MTEPRTLNDRDCRFFSRHTVDMQLSDAGNVNNLFGFSILFLGFWNAAVSLLHVEQTSPSTGNLIKGLLAMFLFAKEEIYIQFFSFLLDPDPESGMMIDY